ncbi:MAG: hypothetical protein IT393_06760 [Nitrospirae bacterium]|nr:hypothetical protein [Nitrospirota bacterium]
MKHSYFRAVTLTFSIFYILLSSGQLVFAKVACPPPLKMVSSTPRHLSEGVSLDAPVIIEWDKKTLETLSEGLRDLVPALESINIAGGRYRMGTLLTTEWGIGGSVSWTDNGEMITPEAPFEPGTQYRLWTMLYLTIRDGDAESCPGIGGEVVFKTAGTPPADGNPVRKLDLSKIYHGDQYGHGDIRGMVRELDLDLSVMTVDDARLGSVILVIYKGIPIFKEGQLIQFGMIKTGDNVSIRITGGRVVTVEVSK